MKSVMYLINVLLTIIVAVEILDQGFVEAQGHSRGKMTQKLINSIIKLHNGYRRGEGASNMKQLKWSPKLQRDAQIWANKCRYAHAYGKWGENLFKVESHLPDDVLIERAINEWYFEKTSWKFTPDCSEACHYTQVVWANTEEVGCAFKRCPTLFLREEFIPNGWMLVCYYNSQGNIIGEMPYTIGKPCSACATGYSCNRGLCYKPAPVPRYEPQAQTQPPRPKPTPKIYRAPPNPVNKHVPQRQHYRAQPQNGHQTVAGPQQTSVYQASVKRQPQKTTYRYQPSPYQQSYQQPTRQHQSQRQKQPQHSQRSHPNQPQPATRPHTENPSPNQQQNPQPADHRPIKSYHAQQREWQGNKQVYQQPTIKQPSKVQYISGKILTGWVPSQTTKAPAIPYSNGTDNYSQLSAPASRSTYQHHAPSMQNYRQKLPAVPSNRQHAPVPAVTNNRHFSPPQTVAINRKQPPAPGMPQTREPLTNKYSRQNEYTSHAHNQQRHSPAQQSQLNAHPSPAHYQQPHQGQPRHAPQKQISKSHTHAMNYQHKYPAQTQQPNTVYQQSPVTHPQQPSNSLPAGGLQNPTISDQTQRQPQYATPTQVQKDQYRETPAYSYVQNQDQSQPYAANTNQQSYPQRQGQGSNQQYYQEQRPPQENAGYVDPRPIYVPPAPAAPPPPTTTTPPPFPVQSCSDVDKNCKHWGVYCKTNPYVHDNCRMTCQTCAVPTPPLVPVKTTAMPTTTPRPSIIPSQPPSPISPIKGHNFQQPRQQQRRPTPQPQSQNPTTTAAYYPQTTGYNNNYASTQASYNAPPGGPAFGPCRDYDNRCRQWAKYCGIDEYVDDMCRLTCMRCPK